MPILEELHGGSIQLGANGRPLAGNHLAAATVGLFPAALPQKHQFASGHRQRHLAGRIVPERPHRLFLGRIDLEPHVDGNDFQVSHLSGHFRPLIFSIERHRSGFDTLIGESGIPEQHAIEEETVTDVGTKDTS